MAIRPANFMLFCFCFILVSFCASQISAYEHKLKKGQTCNVVSDCGHNEQCVMYECVNDPWAWKREHEEREFQKTLYITLAAVIPGVLLIVLIICCCCSCCPCYRCCKKPKKIRKPSGIGHANIAYDHEGNPLIVETAQLAYGTTSKGQYQDNGLPVTPPPPVVGWVEEPATVQQTQYQYTVQYPNQSMQQQQTHPYQSVPPQPYQSIPPQPYHNMPPVPYPPPSNFQNGPPPPYFEGPSAPNYNDGNSEGGTKR